jgi:2-dehydro-3-deoxyphosphogluconate aldolase/(4S)-4-hydroxy-2-oxoglutarate aldolase
MDRNQVRARIEEIGIIPSVRVSSKELALFAAETVNQAGIPVAEITMTVPGAIEVIAQLVRSDPGFVVGAGTVLLYYQSRPASKGGGIRPEKRCGRDSWIDDAKRGDCGLAGGW